MTSIRSITFLDQTSWSKPFVVSRLRFMPLCRRFELYYQDATHTSPLRSAYI